MFFRTLALASALSLAACGNPVPEAPQRTVFHAAYADELKARDACRNPGTGGSAIEMITERSESATIVAYACFNDLTIACRESGGRVALDETAVNWFCEMPF